MEVLKAKAKLENLDLFLDFIKQFNKKNNISEAVSTEIILVAEEIIVNVMNYAYPDYDNGEVEINLSTENDLFKFNVIDSGQPFDITAAEDPDVTLSVDERDVGGVGIFLVKNIMDSISYKRENSKNILKLTKSIK